MRSHGVVFFGKDKKAQRGKKEMKIPITAPLVLKEVPANQNKQT
jgi:hypothetical protein